MEVEAWCFVRANRSLGTIRLSFEVADIHKFAAQLKEQGVKFLYEPRKEYGFWLAEFEDPEGNVLRLYQRLHAHDRVA